MQVCLCSFTHIGQQPTNFVTKRGQQGVNSDTLFPRLLYVCQSIKLFFVLFFLSHIPFPCNNVTMSVFREYLEGTLLVCVHCTCQLNWMVALASAALFLEIYTVYLFMVIASCDCYPEDHRWHLCRCENLRSHNRLRVWSVVLIFTSIIQHA
jgi:hypothetical protein